MSDNYAAAAMVASIAKPGDPDLDCDLTDLTVTAVTVDDREILIGLRAPTGRWVGVGDTAMGDVGGIAGWYRCRLPTMPADLFAAYVILLHRWRDDGTALRMCGAPGKVSTLQDAGGRVLLLPRRPDPLEAP